MLGSGFGDQQLRIGVGRGVARTATKAHLATAVDGLAVWRIHLVAVSVIAIESVPIPSCGRFECRDPSDHRLESIQPLATTDEGAAASRQD